jgi:competence protein ComEC
MRARIIGLGVMILLLTSLLAGCLAPAPVTPGGGTSQDPEQPPATGETTISFIDVGQADSILLQSDGRAGLIDAGNNADGQLVIDYLKQHGVERLDFVIGTHPHEDHIGGLDAVIKAFPVARVYLPEVTTDTRSFEDLLLAIRDKQLTITPPDPGLQFTLGSATCTILGPLGKEYESLNDDSIILRVTCGETAFLFAGDAGSAAEQEQLAAGTPLSAQVLKVGHHGSSSSSSAAFLAAVKPEWAVISVGADNTYGHPHHETMTRLANAGAKVYRTDESGTVVITSDGVDLEMQTER